MVHPATRPAFFSPAAVLPTMSPDEAGRVSESAVIAAVHSNFGYTDR